MRSFAFFAEFDLDFGCCPILPATHLTLTLTDRPSMDVFLFGLDLEGDHDDYSALLAKAGWSTPDDLFLKVISSLLSPDEFHVILLHIFWFY